MHKKNGLACLALLALAFTVPSAAARAQGGEMATVALEGIVAGKLIDKFEEAGSRLIKQGEKSGNVLLSRWGDEVSLVTQNLKILLADQRSTLFDDLTRQQQQAFIELNKVIKVAEEAPDRLASLAELATLDMVYLLPPVLGPKPEFYVSSINGLVQTYQDADYPLTIRGLGFALDDSERRFEVELSVDGNAVPATALRRGEKAHELVVAVPSEALKKRFDKSKPVHVPVMLTSTVLTRGGKAKKYEVGFNLILLPLVAGTIELEEEFKVKKLAEQEVELHTLTSVTSEKLNGHKAPFDVTQEWKAPDDAVITGVRYECPAGDLPNPGGIAGFTYNLRRLNGSKEYDPDFDILESGKKVIVYRRCTFGGTTTVHHHVLGKKYEDAVIKVKRTVELTFHDKVAVDLDPRNSNSAWTAKGKLVTGHKIDVNRDTAPGGDSLLKLLGSGAYGDHTRLTFKLAKP